jgi:hypothetical protein
VRGDGVGQSGARGDGRSGLVEWDEQEYFFRGVSHADGMGKWDDQGDSGVSHAVMRRPCRIQITPP